MLCFKLKHYAAFLIVKTFNMNKCAFFCDPFRPCHRPGCRHAGNVLIGAGNEADRDLQIQVNDSLVRGRRGGQVRMGYGNAAGRDSYMKANRNQVLRTADDVDIGVGNDAGRDNRMEVNENVVKGGSRGSRARIGDWNYAANDNLARISRNEIEDAEDDVDIGVGNRAGWDNCMDISDNKVKGRGVRLGGGNRAGGNNCTRISGNIIE